MGPSLSARTTALAPSSAPREDRGPVNPCATPPIDPIAALLRSSLRNRRPRHNPARRPLCSTVVFITKAKDAHRFAIQGFRRHPWTPPMDASVRRGACGGIGESTECGDEVRWILSVINNEDGGGGRPHPGVPRGAPRRCSLY
jgi:hypothetical protein